MPEWSDEAFDDFRSEMFWAVQEGAFLFELPAGALDYTRDAAVRHGPWESADCSRALMGWFDHGWISLALLPEQALRWTPGSISVGAGGVVDRAEARAILSGPDTWTSEHPEGFLVVMPADHAPSGDFRDLWLDAVQRPR